MSRLSAEWQTRRCALTAETTRNYDSGRRGGRSVRGGAAHRPKHDDMQCTIAPGRGVGPHLDPGQMPLRMHNIDFVLSGNQQLLPHLFDLIFRYEISHLPADQRCGIIDANEIGNLRVCVENCSLFRHEHRVEHSFTQRLKQRTVDL